MAHTTRDRDKLLNRVRRIRGQINAIEKALDGNEECSNVLQTIAACRGAINGLMAEVLEGHVRFHVIDSRRKQTVGQAEATEELIDLVNRYLR
jgi:DNA-binding FrmR family transcriptional regulator